MPIFLAIKQVKKYPTSYLLLSVILLVLILLFTIFYGNPEVQRQIVIGGTLSYVLWSLFHHYRKGDLHVSIILEYFLIGIVACLVLSLSFF